MFEIQPTVVRFGTLAGTVKPDDPLPHSSILLDVQGTATIRMVDRPWRHTGGTHIYRKEAGTWRLVQVRYSEDRQSAA